MPQATHPPIVLYDGECGMCASSVAFIRRHSAPDAFHFAPLGSEIARREMESHGLIPEALDSVVLIDAGGAFVRSAAVLRIARRLRFPWWLLAAARIVPRPLRDWCYDRVARARRRDGVRCQTPDAQPPERDR